MRYIISESDRMQCIVLSLEGGAHATSSIGNLLRLRTCEADMTNEKKHSMRSELEIQSLLQSQTK